MTDLTIEALRSELRSSFAPVREELAFLRRGIIALQQDTRSLKAANE